MSSSSGPPELRLSPSFRYDQAAVLTDIILAHVRARQARSLLDVGAGDGSVAVPVSRGVRRYVAVEEDPLRAASLREAGLDVVAASFPVAIGERFDMVVASHSVPEGDISLYPAFLAGAWECLLPGGELLIVTFKGAYDSEIHRLSAEMLGVTYAPDRRYTTMLRILGAYGDVSTEKRCSHVETVDFDDVAAYFGTWFWETPEERRAREPKLRVAVNDRFRRYGTYRIPTQHLVIATRKAAS